MTEWLRLEGASWGYKGPSGPTPLLKQFHLQQVAQHHVQMVFEDLLGRLYNVSGQPVSVLNWLHSKKLFLDIWMELLVFQFAPLISYPGHWHPLERGGKRRKKNKTNKKFSLHPLCSLPLRIWLAFSSLGPPSCPSCI